MIEINNLTRIGVDKNLIEKISQSVLHGEKREGGISLAFVGPRRMREINKNYRGRNKVTNVLAFSEKGIFCEKLALGEIIICLQAVRKGAQENKCGFEEELSRVLIHGILHILGYEHEGDGRKADKMREREEHYLKKITR